MPYEHEQKYDVDPSFRLPELTSVVEQVIGKPVKTLIATYYDTEDLRLVRAGASLRHRVGDALPWTVKLATGIPGVRQEISQPGGPREIPQDLVWLVASLTRGATLAPVAVLRSERQRFDLCDASGAVLAELADDLVSTQTREFREIEVELKAGEVELLSTVERELVAAGARPGRYPSKLARALEVTDAGGEPEPDDVVARAITRAVRRLLDHDPLVRLGEPLPDGDTAVHQMRVATRRLRTLLRTPKALRAELGWLAGLLGAARDIEVLRLRLCHTAGVDPLAEMDSAAIDLIDATLHSRQRQALSELAEGMRGSRYLKLLDRLQVATSRTDRRPARQRADEAAADLVEPHQQAPDTEWHQLRIKVKRARYVAEAATDRKDPLPRVLARMQELLGEHQDAAVAGQTWLSFGEQPALAITAGRLYERERAAVRQARAALPALWYEWERIRSVR